MSSTYIVIIILIRGLLTNIMWNIEISYKSLNLFSSIKVP